MLLSVMFFLPFCVLNINVKCTSDVAAYFRGAGYVAFNSAQLVPNANKMNPCLSYFLN